MVLTGRKETALMKKVYLVQGYHHCSIGDALKKYLKGLGTYSVEAIDMFAIEPEMIDFREADIVILTMGVEPEKGKRHPEQFYEVNDKLAYHVASIAKACGVKQFLVLSTTDVYGRNLGKVTAKSKPNPKTNYAKSKLNGDRKISELNNENFHVSILRFPVVEGTKNGILNQIQYAGKKKISMQVLLDTIGEVLEDDDSGLKVISA